MPVNTASKAEYPAPSDPDPDPSPADPSARSYVLEDQIGHLLRRAHQRASAIFMDRMAIYGLTPTQFAALVKLLHCGPLSQNHLGRLAAMDAATMQGVIRRLLERGLVARTPDRTDRRRLILRLTGEGETLIRAALGDARSVSTDTLAPLTPEEQDTVLALLQRLG